MPKLIVLGTSNAIPDEKHENTHMAVVGKDHLLLIDCVNNPIVRMRQAGLDVLQITDIILTHFHPDHVSGVPSLLMNSWLLGRKKSLNLYGLSHTLDRVKRLMDFYDWGTWPNFFPVYFNVIAESEMTSVIKNNEMHVMASPVHHLVPTIGLRIEFPQVGSSMAYSCDTEPCSEVVRLANGVDVLLHESTGDTTGHSSAAQAGQIARKAEASKLFLIHYRTGDYDPSPLLVEAEKTFSGPVFLAEDFMQIVF
jgi:ribonuclease Z